MRRTTRRGTRFAVRGMVIRGVSHILDAAPLTYVPEPTITIDNNMIIDVEATATRLPQNYEESAATELGDAQRFEEYLALGIKSAQAGDRVKARTLLTAAADLNPESESAWLWLASISEYPEELLVFLNHVLEINPHNERALSWGRSTKALMAKTLIQRGVDASAEGNRDLAIECFDQAIEYDPRNETAWMWMASLAEDERRKIELLERVLSINPDNADAKAAVHAAHQEARDRLLNDARRAAAGGNFAVSHAYVNELLNKFPNDEQAWELRSHTVSDLGERAEAYEMLLTINPDNTLARAGVESLRSILAAAHVVDPKDEITEEVLETPMEIEAPSELVSIDDDAILEFSGSDELDESAIENIDTGDLVFSEEMSSFSEEISTQSEKTEIGSQPKEEKAWEEVSVESQTEEWVVSPVEEITEQQVDSEAPSPEQHDETPVYLAAATVEPFGYPEVSAYSEAAAPAAEKDESSPWNALADESPVSETDFSEVEGETVTEPASVEETEQFASEDFPALVSEDPFAEKTVEVEPSIDVHQPESASATPTILVVDDNPVIRKLISGKLEESGYNVVCAEDGRSAAAMIKGSAPAIVLLDITLPKMDGYEVCRNIRMNEATKNIPVIMISGKDGYYEENRGKSAGATGFITKPFGPETLMRTVESHLRKAESNS